MSRTRPLRHTLRSWAVLPQADPRTAAELPERPAPRAPLMTPRAADLVLTGLVLFASVWNSLKNPYLGPSTPWANVLLAAVSALPLLARRRTPEPVLAVALLAEILHVSMFVLPCAYYAEGAYRGPRSRRTAWAAAGAGLVMTAPRSVEAWSSLRVLVTWFTVNFVLDVLVPLLLGLYVGQRRAVLAGLVERAERAEREQRLIAEAARAEERQRIAGEMHDVVSHQVSLIVVHANALGAVSHDAEVTTDTARIIQTAGRRALTELREMLGVLRDGPDKQAEKAAEPPPDRPESARAHRPEGADGGAGPSPAPEAERPSDAVVGRITELADSSRSAGLPVSVHVEGGPRALPEPVGRAAHRVVQEALTNVHKHAPGATTDIRLAFTAGTVRVGIVNGPQGRPVDAAPDGGGPLLPSGGHGLLGLAERVRLVGGTIESGPTGDGGFRVDAALPTQGPAD
ncbi:sensor histidine kinase [Streptomyces reniochalinae]|uniref:histidine kinase n=1 Tax=Streptomyces reniochalinae TaxID=2250578 RepID=A0A367E731_9ACTN|nr:histidine kinase [Streptomyces reniochalinae]RCG13505.1 two-component sensor histidine kinase [Streptomyces reniochalinae]